MKLVDVQTFVRVAEHGTIAGAARQLGIPKSTISRRISRLEEDLGMPLLHRSPRSVTVTELGRLVQQRSTGALRELEGLERSIVDEATTPTGTLRITAPYAEGTLPQFASLCAAFRKRWPGVNLSIDLNDRVVDLVEEGYDFGLRPHDSFVRRPDPRLMMQPLWSHRMGLFASPAYLEANGFPRSPDEIRNHAFVGHRLSLSAAALFAKRYDGWAALVGMEASVLASDFIIVTNLIAQGLGIGVAPSVIAATHLASGTLVQVLPALDFGTHLFVLTWPKALQLSGRIRTFVELAAGHCQTKLL